MMDALTVWVPCGVVSLRCDVMWMRPCAGATWEDAQQITNNNAENTKKSTTTEYGFQKREIRRRRGRRRRGGRRGRNRKQKGRDKTTSCFLARPQSPALKWFASGPFFAGQGLIFSSELKIILQSIFSSLLKESCLFMSCLLLLCIKNKGLFHSYCEEYWD